MAAAAAVRVQAPVETPTTRVVTATWQAASWRNPRRGAEEARRAEAPPRRRGRARPRPRPARKPPTTTTTVTTTIVRARPTRTPGLLVRLSSWPTWPCRKCGAARSSNARRLTLAATCVGWAAGWASCAARAARATTASAPTRSAGASTSLSHAACATKRFRATSASTSRTLGTTALQRWRLSATGRTCATVAKTSSGCRLRSRRRSPSASSRTLRKRLRHPRCCFRAPTPLDTAPNCCEISREVCASRASDSRW
mmetsp:Transcript_24062/g.83518  ORF Transcript_24062/g.83518 Transcript_24062/m.83518 type:complete len:255 (-) Transcript_24062:1705-2469(-)